MSKSLQAAIRQAIESSDETPYSIAKGSGVSRSQLSRLINGERGLSVESIEKLSDYLGYQIQLTRKRSNKRKGP